MSGTMVKICSLISMFALTVGSAMGQELADFDFAYIDKTGKVVITGPFADAKDFSGSTAQVKIKALDWQNNKWISPKSTDKVLPGRVDLTGKIVDTPESKSYQQENKNSTKLSSLTPATRDGKLWGFVDESGNFVIEPKYLHARTFQNGRALVKTEPRSEFGTQKDDAQYLFLTGKRALSEHDLEKAKAAFLATIKLAPGTPNAKKSRYFLESATPIKPVAKNVVEMLKQVEMSEAVGNSTEANTLLNKCFSEAPHSEWVAIKVTASKINEGKREEARKILDKMLEINNKFAPTYVHMAHVAFSAGDEKEAKRLIEKAYQLNPYSELVKSFYPYSASKMKTSVVSTSATH